MSEPERPPREILRDMFDAIVKAWRIEQVVKWIDRQLRRWPWLYERLGRPPGRVGRALHAVLHPWSHEYDKPRPT